MSEEMLVRHCSPTLAGIKTGSLFGCEFSSREELVNELRRFNSIFSGKGLRVVSLSYQNGRALIYIYRPAQLSRDLDCELSCRLLKSHGYPCGSCERCIRELSSRLKSNGDFPHEIGLCLGYPPEDVSGFIEHKAKGCKCVGTWKVYGDEKKAAKTFARYKKCTELYLRQLHRGFPIDRLAVRAAN